MNLASLETIVLALNTAGVRYLIAGARGKHMPAGGEVDFRPLRQVHRTNS